MWWIFIIGIGIVLVGFFAILLLMMKQMSSTTEEMPFTLNKSILTDREKQFMKKLEPAARELGLTVCPKVRVADIVSVNKGTNERQKWFNKISSKHVDYVLCDQEYNIALIVELDDRTHDSATAAKKDEFKNKLFGNRIVRFRTMKEDIVSTLKSAMALQGTEQ